MNENNNEIKLNQYDHPKSTTHRFLKNKKRQSPTPQGNSNVSNENKIGVKKFSNLFLIIGITVLITVTLSVCLALFLPKNNKEKVNNENNKSDILPTPTPIVEKENKQLLTPIYKLNNTVGDLKRINVQQTSYKNITVNGQTTQFLVYRDTTYDIYIMSEESPEEKNKNYYSKKYSASINIVKECYNNKSENCDPQNFIDFNSNEGRKNLRNLEENDDLKNASIPLCIFNYTDNDAITSISCPESLPENKKYEMMLDFYFFRPPAIERPEMNNPLKNITIETKSTDNRKFTRERNSGICNVNNPLKTHCTTDMNTTTDLNNNLITYDEIAFSNFFSDENNNYIKTKITHLKDITDQTKYLNKEAHKNNLGPILEKLKSYIKYDETFSTEDFKELYYIVKGNSTNTENLNKRNLSEYFSGINPYIKEESLFFTEISGVQINLKLRNDIGIDKIPMTTSSILSLDNREIELVTKSEQFYLNSLLEELIILSKAGNNLANELYDQIKHKLNDITKDIELTISSLNDLIEYEDLVSIFDSTLSVEKLTVLPKEIISESEHLFKMLNKKLIDTTEITEYKKTLNSNIYNFLYESHNLVNGLLEKIKELGDKLGSRKGKLTEIATYYLNYTSDSYTTIVSKSENILRNYYINEKVLISYEINSILKPFEENIKNSVEKEIGIIENIKNKLENKTISIESSNEDDTKNVILNLNKSINIISDIISSYKNKIESSLDLKPSGYFINENEIESFQKRVNETIKEANENAQKFDNDELIDKVYDEIMSNFRQNFTELKNYMNNKRDEIFTMDEDVLKNIKFTENETERFSNYLKTLSSNIANEIINENNNYSMEISNKLNNLISSKKEPLNQLIKNVDALLSETILGKLSNLYKNTFENSLELIKKQINNNKQLLYTYIDYLYQVLSNDTEIIIHIDPYFRYKIGQKTTNFAMIKNTENYIKNKKITKAYLTKYDQYLSFFDSLKDYINNQMNIDLFYLYKNLTVKLKELLQSVKNTKFNDKYNDLTELTFINDNIRIIDSLYIRLDKYFSESLYNNNYLIKYNTFKQNQIQEIEKIKQTLIQKNKLLIDKYEISNDKTNDFCSSYTQVVTHTSNSGNIFSFKVSDEICVNLRYYSDNYNLLVKLSIKSDNNLQELENEFNSFYLSINQNINEYNSVLITLKNEVIFLENKAMNIKGEINGLNDINKYINTILDQKYGNILIKDSYDFYQKNIEKKLENFLNDINEKWIESFEKTESEIKLNQNNFKNQVEEFYIIAYIYIDLLSKDIIYDYTDSIITQQKQEFNYTISYYYNYLYSSVNKTYQYIIGRILSYNNGFNNILDYRKIQVIEKYNEIIERIKYSENNSLNEKNQINLLLVPITNFFKVNNLTQDKIQYLEKKLNSFANTMWDDAFSIKGEEDTAYSISARLYLENSENGKIVQELSDSINRVNFINLNQEKFKELINSYIVFDQENLIGCANKIISQSTLEISAEYQRIRETYIDQLENEIKRYFTKDSLVEKIYLIYKNGINYLDENSRNKILLNVNVILDVITNHIKSESDRLSTTVLYNSNYETINQTIKYYKEKIFNEVKNEMTNLFEMFKRNIYNEIYTDYVEKGLNEYLTETKNAISNNQIFKEYKTLGASYKIGNEINEIVELLSNQYKFIAKEAIENSPIQSDYYNALNLESIEQIINEKIESAFTSYLLPALKKYAVYDLEDSKYESFDLTNDIKNNINSVINENVQKIQNIMDSTKGENYEFQLDYQKEWVPIDFSNTRRIVGKIGINFETYIVHEIDEEKKMFSIYFKNNIKINFNETLDNFITSFGDKFFERVGEYNLLNKIDNLFNNFEYSFIQSYFYFDYMLTENDKFDYLKDLKYKVIKLNDIDLIIEQNKDIILKTFACKIDNFTKVTSDYLIDKYISYMQKDEFTNISEELKNIIIINLFNTKSEMENEYKNSLQKHFKNPLIEKYKKYLKEINDYSIKSIQEYRQDVSSHIKDINTIDTEEGFIEINEKINTTLEQISKYNNHFKQFNISENIKQFLSSYGDNSINPLFENITKLINDATKNIMLQNLDQNSFNYEKKLNITSFYNEVNVSLSFLNKTYINPISTQISLYDAPNYANRLENEKDKIKNRRRRYLENSNTEDVIKQDYSERVADKSLDDTFSKLLDIADNIQSYVDSLYEFYKYDKLITNYINDVKIAIKNSSWLIDSYNFDENTTNILIYKLSHLKNISLSYYYNVNDSFSIIRDYITNSIKEINNELKKCANATYVTFANKYNETFSEEKYAIKDKKYSDNEKEINTIEYNSTTQNGRTFFKIDISGLKCNSEFKFEIKYEEIKKIKKPIIFVSITNKNIPRRMIIKSYEKVGYNRKVGQKMEVNFDDASYSTIINFDTKSTNINITTLVKFDKYSYTTVPVTWEEGNNCIQCMEMMGKNICFSKKDCSTEIENTKQEQIIFIDAKEINKTEVIAN